MILFLDDWKKYPGAIVDTKTKNKSFVELADKYRKMGIKNYFFMLALHQPELQGLDPHDPNLSQEIIAKMYLECQINPWYFFREVFRLPSTGSPTPDPLRANRGNIGMYWSFFNHIDVAITQARQTGKSVGADGINTYVTQVAGRNNNYALYTKDRDLRKKNIQRLKDIRDLLPKWLNPFNPKADADNQETITASIYGNGVSTYVAQSDEAGALNIGRGGTTPTTQTDEGPFCSLAHITLPAFLASTGAARENAKRNGGFYGNIFTTTAGKLDTREGKFCYDMFMGGMTWDERLLFDCKNEEQAHLMVARHTKPGGKPLVYIILSHKQLGYTDEWLYEKVTSAGGTKDEIDRDFFNRWTTGSLSSPLSSAILEKISASVKEPTYIEITERMYTVNWYIPQDEIEHRLSQGKYVLGNDTSSAVGKDAITLLLKDAETLETIFSLALTETNVYTFIEWVAKLLIKYPNIVLIPERRSQGETLIDGLLVKLIASNINPFARIYNHVIDSGEYLKPDKQTEFSFLRREPLTWNTWIADKYKSKFGYATSGSGRNSRDNLYVETLTRLAEIDADNIADRRLVNEISGLVVKRDRIDHSVSGHDDMVIAWLLIGWFLLHSRNLDYYGIEKPAFKAINALKPKVDKPKNEYVELKDKQQESLLATIKELGSKLEEEHDYIEASKLEARIRNLSKRLTTDAIESHSVDDFIKNAKMAKVETLRQRRLG